MKSISLLAAALYSFLTQTMDIPDNAGKLFGMLEVMEGVSCLSLSKNRVHAINIDRNDQNKNLSGDLCQIHFIMYNPGEGTLPGDKFIQTAISLLPSPYKRYIDQQESDPDVEIWMKGEKNKYSECHLFIKNKEADQMQFIVSFYGDFSPELIPKLKNTGKNISADSISSGHFKGYG
jgi:hypothetical protein